MGRHVRCAPVEPGAAEIDRVNHAGQRNGVASVSEKDALTRRVEQGTAHLIEDRLDVGRIAVTGAHASSLNFVGRAISQPRLRPIESFRIYLAFHRRQN
jgi:hypothetical protein